MLRRPFLEFPRHPWPQNVGRVRIAAGSLPLGAHLVGDRPESASEGVQVVNRDLQCIGGLWTVTELVGEFQEPLELAFLLFVQCAFPSEGCAGDLPANSILSNNTIVKLGQ